MWGHVITVTTMILIRLFFLFIFSLVPVSFLMGQDGKNCGFLLSKDNKRLKSPIEIFSSSNMTEDLPILKEAAEHITNIASGLGMATPPHRLYFLPPEEMSALLGGHSYGLVPHWLAGLGIARMSRMKGILEFVEPSSCAFCHSFYKDTTHLMHQISIIMHVLGHNDFGVHSGFFSKVRGDKLAASDELGHLMRHLYKNYDHDKVSQFYQRLATMQMMQDLTYGSYESVDSLKIKGPTIEDLKRVEHVTDSPFIHPRDYQPYKDITKLKPTSSILQAFVANMPSNTPQWQRKMAELFEEMSRSIPGSISTKIINEGWATFSQYLIMRHSQWKDSSSLLEFADLLQGVTVPSISNPYWLGLQSWWRLSERFRERKEIKNLSEWEQDKAFVQYAHDIMSQSDNYSFLRKALDATWVKKYNLYLYRKTVDEDKVGRGDNNIMSTRNAERVIDHIARKVAYNPSHFPRILLKDLKYKDTHVYYHHEVIEGTPLKLQEAAQTLYVLAKLHKQPVLLDTIDYYITFIDKRLEGYFEDFFDRLGLGKSFSDYKNWHPDFFERLQIGKDYLFNPFRIRIQVNPRGEVQVTVLDRDEDLLSGLKLDPAIRERNSDFVVLDSDAFDRKKILRIVREKVQILNTSLQEGVDEYKVDESVSINENLKELQRSTMQETIQAFSARILNFGQFVASYAKGAGGSLMEFERFMQARIYRSLKLAAEGKLPVRLRGNAVAIKALPMMPQFELESEVRNILIKIKGKSDPSPIDRSLLKSTFLQNSLEKDDDMDVGSRGAGVPGDIWPRPPRGGGGGGGRGPRNGGDPDIGIGDGTEDPSEVLVPLDLWAQMLEKMGIDLPNPRRVPYGENNLKGSMRSGSTHKYRPQHIIASKTAREALQWGLGEDGLQAFQDAETSQEQMEIVEKALLDGFKRMPPERYVIKPLAPKPSPEFKAVVVFIIDLSGSMHGEPQEKTKEIFYNIVSLLRLKYEEVAFRFVGYDSKAHEFSEDEIWKTFLGGGTSDATGYELAEKILKEYPREEWNKYVYHSGDGGSFDSPEEVEAIIRRVYEEVQHMGYVHMAMGWDSNSGHAEKNLALSEELKWFSFAKVDEGVKSVIGALKDLFNVKKGK